jgi:hypothetical protein
MSNVGKRWSKEEDQQLTDLYVNQLLNVTEIAKIHGRYTKGIAARLCHLKIVQDLNSARGYSTEEPYNNAIRATISSSQPMNIPREVLSAENAMENKPHILTNTKLQLPECKECICKECINHQNTISILQQQIIKLQQEIISLKTHTGNRPSNPVLDFFGLG